MKNSPDPQSEIDSSKMRVSPLRFLAQDSTTNYKRRKYPPMTLPAANKSQWPLSFIPRPCFPFLHGLATKLIHNHQTKPEGVIPTLRIRPTLKLFSWEDFFVFLLLHLLFFPAGSQTPLPLCEDYGLFGESHGLG